MAHDVETAAARSSATGRPPAGRLAAGTTLADARFTVNAFVRRSPFAEVYQGTDATTGDPVSIHLMHAPLAGQKSVVRAIAARADAVKAAEHRNLARTLHIGNDDGGVFAVTELLDGNPVRDLLARKQRTGGKGFGARGTANIASGVLSALEALHPALAHGSVSPDTVYINNAGRVKLVDLAVGVAVPAAVKAGLIESPPTMAPEDGRTGTPTPAGDIFAVGRLVYELLVGVPLVRGGPRPSDAEAVDVAVDELVARCAAPDPGQRPPTAEALRELLSEALSKKVAPRPSQAVAAFSSPSMSLPSMEPAASGSFSSPALSAPAIVAPAIAAGEEKWLVSKGKLDYGPFSLAAVIEEIRGDQIIPGHSIVNKDTGERWKVEDHPLLADHVDAAKQARDDRRRAAAEHTTVKKESRKGRSLLIFVVVGVAALGIGVFFLVKGRQKAPFAPKVVASQPGDSSWTYAVVVVKGEGEGKITSKEHVLATGAKALGGEVTHTVTWPKVSDAQGYIIYRTASGGEPSSTGEIGRVGPDTLEFVDDGAEGDGSSLAEAMGSLEEGELLAKITFPEPKEGKAPTKRRKRRASGSSGGSDDGSAGLDFGGEGGDEVLSTNQINPVIQRNGRKLQRCMMSKGARYADIEFSIKRTGRVHKVTVDGANSAAASCIQRVVKSMKFPSFNGTFTNSRFDMSL